jgi:hypothetical protein
MINQAKPEMKQVSAFADYPFQVILNSVHIKIIYFPSGIEAQISTSINDCYFNLHLVHEDRR